MLPLQNFKDYFQVTSVDAYVSFAIKLIRPTCLLNKLAECFREKRRRRNKPTW